jgi:putative transposase
MDASDAKQLRALEEENNKLKRLLAENMFDNTALKELLSKK